jgi:hypothetical protein
MSEQSTESSEEKVVNARGYASQVSGNQVQFGPGFAESVSAGETLKMDRSGALVAKSDKDIEVTASGAVALVAGSNLQASNSLSQVMVAGGSADLDNSLTQVVVAGGSVTANHSLIGFLISNQTNLGENNRVIFNTPQAIAFGAALGVVFALLSLLMPKKRRGRR